MAATIEISSFIASRPDYYDGWPHITGTGVTVARVGLLHSSGMSPDDIAYNLSLSLPQVYAAITHYLANQEEIDRQIAAYDEETLRIAASLCRS